ncbi:unnamed protein product [Callosobruchus maculatus]|uniref:Laminin N-terminal domain-containing protein n=1 Tax=Callosobruchus maculatus TaxID=64391 RepID=A0A653BI36_CALMS|nr:unnamed protein product [Callosobruchus maculatus]
MKAPVFVLFCFLCGIEIKNCQEADQTPVIGVRGTKCYDDFNRPQNAAFGLLMEATNTCGDQGPIEYCEQTGVTGTKLCDVCVAGQHDSRYLTDRHHQDNPTWWQKGLRHNICKDMVLVAATRKLLHIEKDNATCRDTYGLPDMTHTRHGEESRALCTSEYSDISPLRGGNVAFGTLEGRPSAYYFEATPELQIMITLDRLNTFGDEMFGDHQVLKSYFYAIADVAVGARCKCNGHATECIDSVAVDGSKRKICKCEHYTAGPDCNECLPFYNDAPWGRANATHAHQCKPASGRKMDGHDYAISRYL